MLMKYVAKTTDALFSFILGDIAGYEGRGR